MDLQPLFIEHYQRTGERLEFAADYHWNGSGHAVVAEVIEASAMFREWQVLRHHGGSVAKAPAPGARSSGRFDTADSGE